MNHSDSTEMDRLLRRYARRVGGSLPAGRGKAHDALEPITGTHLDADELNAYAEGALPEAARSRYFAHLADCDACRKLVTELTLAASAAREAKAHAEATATPPSKAWREWLAAVFSPPVLRFGVPALALFAIIVVAVVALRTQKEQPSFVAQNEEAKRSSIRSAGNSNTTAEASTTIGAENHAQSNTAGNASTTNTSGISDEIAKKELPAPEATPALSAEAAPVTPPPPAQTQTVMDQPAVAKTEAAKAGPRQPGEDDKREQEAAGAGAREAGQPATPANSVRRRRDNEEEQTKVAKEKDEASSNAGAAGGVVQNKPAADEDKVAVRRGSSRSVQGLPTASRAPAPKSEARKEDSENTLSAETRSVGGRRFRRRDGAWVDTAYTSSYPTLDVRRGSDQYRALVADEPSLRAITQQLGGEVIVVWGKRAYRFY